MTGSYSLLRSHLATALGRTCAPSSPAFIAREPSEHRTRELLLQAAWHHRLLRSNTVETCSRKVIEISDPGRWNRQAGPDFADARLIIEGAVVCGDVELHLRASDWERHRHGRDFEYNNVVLHAFLDNDDGRVYDTLHNGRRIERLNLCGLLTADLESLHEALELEDLPQAAPLHAGFCQHALIQLGVPFVRDFIQAAARERMEQKARRFAGWMAADSPDQALYQTLFTMLGQKASRPLFLLLARRAVVEELKSILTAVGAQAQAEALESVFLHVAGLIRLPEEAAQCADITFDQETQRYLESLARWWSRLAGYYLDRLMIPSNRWRSGARPAGFPERRLAGIARVLTNLQFTHGLVDAFMQLFRQSAARHPRSPRDWQREIKGLASVFLPEQESYWSRRYTLGGSRTSRPVQLMGTSCAHHLLFNAVLPAMLAMARVENDIALEEHAWGVFENFPALESNAVSRFMRERILAAMPAGTVNMRREVVQQGLLHIFYDCCQADAKGCDQCGLRTQM